MANITLSSEQLQALIAQAVQAALGSPVAASKSGVDGKTDRSLKNEIATVRAFKKAGYKDVQPRVNVMTYNRWIANGRKVKKGEQSIKVKNLRLFHVSQTETITAEEKAAEMAKMEDAIAAYQAKKNGEQRQNA